MKLTDEDFENLAGIAYKAAKDAGKYIQSEVAKDHKIKNKNAGDSLASQVVTEVDINSQNIILSHLNPLIKKYDLGLLAEEYSDNHSRLEKDYFWCIDPLDGTLSFTKKQPGYSVSIALVSQKGESILGVVYDPVDDIVYHAIKGIGLFYNNNTWQPQIHKPLMGKSLKIFYDSSFLTHPKQDFWRDKIQSLTIKTKISQIEWVRYGGAVMNAISVLLNSPAIYFKPPKKENGGGSLWDFAATAVIFEEAKAHISDMESNPLNLNQTHSTYMNRNGILYISHVELSKSLLDTIK